MLTDKSIERAYQRTKVPVLATGEDPDLWLTQLKRSLAVASPCTDQIELQWLDEVYQKQFDELATSDSSRLTLCDHILGRKISAMLRAKRERERERERERFV